MSEHRWAKWIESPEIVSFLCRAKEQLRIDWERDKKYKRYPMDTAYRLAYLRGELRRNASGKHPVKQPRKRLFIARTPRTLSELVPERFVRSIWEDQHSGSFDDAIRVAAEMRHDNQGRPWKVFRGILKAMEDAYHVVFFGPEIMSMPKVSLLHRGLKHLAMEAGLKDQTRDGLAEFLDDICPCGLRSHREAVRKLESRAKRFAASISTNKRSQKRKST